MLFFILIVFKILFCWTLFYQIIFNYHIHEFINENDNNILSLYTLLFLKTFSSLFRILPRTIRLNNVNGLKPSTIKMVECFSWGDGLFWFKLPLDQDADLH